MVEISKNILLQESNKTSRMEQVGIWIHEHPTTVKVLKAAGLVLGAGMLASLPFTAPFIGTGLMAGIAVAGTLLTLTSAVAFLALDILVPPHHDMKNHVYKPAQCEGGKLYYEGDVPVLSLDSDDPFKAGKAQGYLCGEAINRLSKRFALVLHTIARRPRADQLPNTLAGIKELIPAEYLREIEGLAEGYNQWAQEQRGWSSPKKLTVDEALLFHLIPDSLHFQPGAFEPALTKWLAENVAEEQAVACTAIVERDPQKGFVFARNMDWPSFGLAGAYSLVIHRKHANGLLNTVEVGVPGFVGTLTGMNSRGLTLAMNVCAGKGTMSLKGMPASLYNRVCLERCRTVDDVERFVKDQSPLGAYHLTVADPNRAESVHFYQSPEKTHVIRRWEENRPLSTLNCRYNPKPNCPMHHSDERQERIDEFFQDREDRPLEDALSLPFVNNWITTHRVVMEPQNRIFKVAFDNAFAGQAPLHEVSTQHLLR